MHVGTSFTRCASLPNSLPSSSRVSLTRRSWRSAVVLAERAFGARGLASPGPFLGAISVLLRAACLWLGSVSGFCLRSTGSGLVWEGFRFVSVFWACSVRRRYMLLRGNLEISYEPRIWPCCSLSWCRLRCRILGLLGDDFRKCLYAVDTRSCVSLRALSCRISDVFGVLGSTVDTRICVSLAECHTFST